MFVAENDPDRLLEEGYRLQREGRTSEALTTLNKAAESYEAKIKSGYLLFRGRLGETLEFRSTVHSESGDQVAAGEDITEAVALRREISEEGEAHQQADLALALGKLGAHQRTQKSLHQALKSFGESADLLRELAAQDQRGYAAQLGQALYQVGWASWDENLFKDSVNYWGEAAGVYQDLARTGSPEGLRNLATVLSWKARAEKQMDDTAAEGATLTELVQVLESVCGAPGADISDQRDLAQAKAALASSMGWTMVKEGTEAQMLGAVIDALSSAVQELQTLYAGEIPKIGHNARLWYELAWFQRRAGRTWEILQTRRELEFLADSGVPGARSALAKVEGLVG